MSRSIPLSKGQTALVDAADFDLLNQWKWHFTHKGYAARTIFENGKRKTVFMHRVLMNAQPGQFVDHRDGNRLNNTRANLRFATRNQNQWNRQKQKNSTSGYKGVSQHHGRWQARIRVHGKRIHLGYFDDPKQAALIYDAAAKHFFSTFANTNRPKDWNIPAHIKAQLEQILAGNRPQTPRKPRVTAPAIPKAKSRYHGVYWERGRWRAAIRVGSGKVHLGYFQVEEDAARAYDRGARLYRGGGAVLNFPTDTEPLDEAVPLATLP
jgi:hypothetical protein